MNTIEIKKFVTKKVFDGNAKNVCLSLMSTNSIVNKEGYYDLKRNYVWRCYLQKV